MDKLYWIICEEKGVTLFEGRFQGRTRGGAIKFLKDQIGRPGLNGTVFTVTEIPVPLIRETVGRTTTVFSVTRKLFTASCCVGLSQADHPASRSASVTLSIESRSVWTNATNRASWRWP